MPERVRITDVAPRDGLQNEPNPIPTEHKLRLIELLAAAAPDEIEITSFVSPKWIPQLADAEQVAQQVKSFAQGIAQITAAFPVRAREAEALPVFSVLVPNEQGFERALALHDAKEFPLKIALFTAASEAFNKKNTNASIDESIARFAPIVPHALDAGMQIRFYISCAVECPFAGHTEPSAVRTVVDILMDLVPPHARAGIDIDLGDTVGVAHPADIAALCAEHTDLLAQTTLHLHDTSGRATDCVRTALELGVRSFDGAAGGLGGCPYASTPEKRAPGNIDCAALVRTVHEAGFETGIDLDALDEAGAFAQTLAVRS
jgi:hydroxymethylglutaryl-CoA lyase